jgi:hypothetical protein
MYMTAAIKAINNQAAQRAFAEVVLWTVRTIGELI